MKSVRWLSWITFFCLLIACSDSVQQFSSVPKRQEATNSVKEMLEGGVAMPASLGSMPSVTQFYKYRGFEKVWTTDNTLTQNGDSLLQVLQNVTYYGLLPEDYHYALVDELVTGAAIHPTEEKLNQLEVIMTDALLSMAYHIRHGRMQPDTLFVYKELPTVDTMLIQTVSETVETGRIKNALEQFEPANFSYKVLKNSLKDMLDSLQSTPAWNVPLRSVLQDRIQLLTVNMEQLRWEANNRPAEYIRVNIPSYRLEIVRNDSLVFESNVVVGSMTTPTPTLRSVVKSFVLYPNWNVPRKIATQELLPKIQKDSAYLVSNRYRVYDPSGKLLHPDSIQWSRYHHNNFPFLLQQSEGDHNALGIIKFIFDNDYGVYLHDTNAKRFFKKDIRAYSHGCIRVEKAVQLAHYLLQSDDRCTPADLEKFLSKRQQRQICLRPIDLQIQYYTCEARQDGSVQFHHDIYSRTGKLVEAMYCRNNL